VKNLHEQQKNIKINSIEIYLTAKNAKKIRKVSNFILVTFDDTIFKIVNLPVGQAGQKL